MPETSLALANPLSLFDVSDRVAIITGASGAFGRIVAISLGALGCKLLLASGSAEPLAEVAAEVAAVGGTAPDVRPPARLARRRRGDRRGGRPRPTAGRTRSSSPRG